MAGAVDVVDGLIREQRQGAVIAVNPEKVMKARQDSRLLSQLQGAALLIPDGIGVVWAARLLGLARLQRVPGADLMPAICAMCARKGYSVFLFGAAPEVNARAGEVLASLYPGIRIAGSQHGYASNDELAALPARINASGADVVFVALGSPRQELWMARYLPELTAKACQGVGGTFDVLAGTVQRAPGIVRALNLEWAYRLMLQPRRLPRQGALPQFVWQVLASRFSRDRGLSPQ